MCTIHLLSPHSDYYGVTASPIQKSQIVPVVQSTLILPDCFRLAGTMLVKACYNGALDTCTSMVPVVIC